MTTNLDRRPEPNHYERSESEAHRLDRNYSELLQELRVAETGVQILFAFLLAIAFQQRFTSIGLPGRAVYLTTLFCCALAAVLLIAPVAMHRRLFAQRRKDEIVELTSRFAVAGLAFLALGILGAVLFIVSFVVSWTFGIGSTVGLAVIVVGTWLLLPPPRRADVRSVRGSGT